MPEHLVGPAVEQLGTLRMIIGERQVGHRLNRLDECRPVVRTMIVGSLHSGLDDVERLPAAEHVRVGRDILGIGDGRSIVVDAHGCAVGGIMA